MRFVWIFTLLLLLGAPTALFAGDKPPVIVSYEEDTLHTFERVGKGFKMNGTVETSAMPAPPVPIQAASSKGYVMVKLNGKSVWLDRMDVELEPKEMVKGCSKTIGIDSDVQTYGTNGFGDQN